MSRPAPLKWGNLTVPYTAAWTAEDKSRRPRIVIERLPGTPHRLNWKSEGVSDPTGKPIFTLLHADRCRQVVRERICQMCCGPLPPVVVTMNQGQADLLRPLISDGLPMCPRCAVEAADSCPGLQRQAASGELRIWLSPRGGWLLAPVVLGVIPPSEGGDERVNELVRAAGSAGLWTGPKLVLTNFSRLTLEQLRAQAAR